MVMLSGRVSLWSLHSCAKNTSAAYVCNDGDNNNIVQDWVWGKLDWGQRRALSSLLSSSLVMFHYILGTYIRVHLLLLLLRTMEPSSIVSRLITVTWKDTMVDRPGTTYKENVE